MTFEASWPDPEIVSHEFGSLYMPDDMVDRHSDGREIKPFRTAMVYGAHSPLAAVWERVASKCSNITIA